MKALILAAGKGTRLKHLTESRPKCLVQINGKSILDYQLDVLEKNGIDDTIVVTGYCAEQVDRHLKGRAKSILNRDYETTNSIYSIWLAQQQLMDEDFVLLNGDIILEADLICRLIEQNVCAALVDNDKLLMDGEMNVIIKDNQIIKFSKTVKAAEAHGESVQVTQFGIKEAKLLFDRLDELIQLGERQQFPAFAFDAIFEQSVMRPVFTQGGQYFEIDTLEDYEDCCHKIQF